MTAYWTVLLSFLTADIAGVRSEWLCNDTCCAGARIIDGKKCEKLQSCAESEGQYIYRAGNMTQDNKCWCNECKRFAQERPKRCWEKNEFCSCKQCPEGTTPLIKDKNGQYVEYFDEKKHCKPLPNPSCDNFDYKIGIGFFVGFASFLLFVVSFILWICCCDEKYTCVFKFMTKEKYLNALKVERESHENALREKDSELTTARQRHESALRDKDSELTTARQRHESALRDKVCTYESHENALREKDSELTTARQRYEDAIREKDNALKAAQDNVILMGAFVLDKTLITKFEKGGLLSREDTEQWIKDTFQKIPTDLRQERLEDNSQEAELILRDLEASKNDVRFPLGERMHRITKRDEQYIIRCIAIDVLKDILRSKSVKPDRTTLLGCLTNSGYDDLARSLQNPPNPNRSAESESGTQGSDDGWENIKMLAQTAFNWTVVTEFKKNDFLTTEDIKQWLKDTFTNIFDANQRTIQAEYSGEDRLLKEWDAIVNLDDKFPLVIDVPSRGKIRQTAIATLMKVIKDKGDSRSPTCTPGVFHICLSEAGYGRLVKKLKDLGVGGASSNP